MFHAYVTIVLVMVTSLGTQGCYCPRGPKTNKEQWCTSNIVISGTVLSKTIEREAYGMVPRPPVMKYKIRVEEVFKGSASQQKTLVFNTYTDTNRCGLTVLKPRRRYLLGAWDYGGGDIWINYCDWHKKRHRVTQRELATLRSGYRCFAPFTFN